MASMERNPAYVDATSAAAPNSGSRTVRTNDPVCANSSSAIGPQSHFRDGEASSGATDASRETPTARSPIVGAEENERRRCGPGASAGKKCRPAPTITPARRAASATSSSSSTPGNRTQRFIPPVGLDTSSAPGRRSPSTSISAWQRSPIAAENVRR